MINFINIIRGRRKFLALLSIVTLAGLTGFAGWGGRYLSDLDTHYSMKQFAPEKHPLIEKEERIQELFQTTKNPQILTLLDLGEKEEGTWLEESRISNLQSAQGALEEIKGVEAVLSIGNIEGATDTAEGINVGPLLDDTPSDRWAERIQNDPLLSEQLISKDKRTIMIIFDTAPLSNDEVLDAVAAARTILEKTFPESKIQVGGVAAMQASVSTLLAAELQNLCLFALLAMIIALALVFRNFTSVLVPLYLTAIANIIVLTCMAIAKMPFTMLSTTLPIIVSVTVVSMVTHTMLRFAKEWVEREPKNLPKSLIIWRTVRELFMANLLTSLTTCVGFAALVTANVPLITQYGTIVAIGVMVSWAVTMLALPPALYLLPVPLPRPWTQKSARWSIRVMQNAKPIFIALCVLLVGLAIVGRDQVWTGTLFDDMPQGHEARTSTERIDQQLGGMIPLDVVIRFSEIQAWNNPELVAKLDAIVKKWRTLPEVGSVLALSDFLRASAEGQTNRLPASRGEVAESYFLYSLSSGRPLDQFLTNEATEARIAVRLHDIPGEEMAVLVAKLEKEVQAAFPKASVEMGNMATTVHNLRIELSRSMVDGFWEALGLISLLLLFMFRSLRWTLVAIVPNLFPPVALLAFMAIFKTAIEPGIAIIFSIALGLAFNNTVYLIGRIRSLAPLSESSRLRVQRALYLEGVPCVLSTVSLVAGFTVFLVSYFQLNQFFGAYMLVSIVAGLVGDLFFLPTMLKLFPNLVPAVRQRNKRALEIKIQPQEKESEMSPAIAASIAMFFLLLPATTGNAAKPLTAEQILERVNKNMRSTDESAKVKMSIIEKNGSVKRRELEIKRKAGDEKKSVLVRLMAPGDIRGTGLLSIEESGKKDQWLYLPSSKRSRRILSNNQGGGFLGSELSYEDMGGSAGVDFQSRVLKYENSKSGQVAVIESTPKKGESAYSKIVSWVPVGKDGFVITKAQYYDKKGKLLKVAQFSGYKRFDKKILRATKMQIKNVQNERGTVMILNNLSVNRGLEDNLFTVSNLEETI